MSSNEVGSFAISEPQVAPTVALFAGIVPAVFKTPDHSTFVAVAALIAAPVAFAGVVATSVENSLPFLDLTQ